MVVRTAAFLLACSACHCAHVPSTIPKARRREVIALGVSAISSPVALISLPAIAEPSIQVYFGAGCFWHVQHELFGEETAGTLQRNSLQATVATGYAGGLGTSADGKVCYHNKDGVADYGKLGHAECVQVEIPASAFPQFCTKYFSLFGKDGVRHDPKDRGGEYRSILGLAGGERSPMYAAVKKAAAESPGGMQLARGRGDEPDTFNERLVYVYDSDAFPFYPAELYHQFHNDYLGNLRPGEPVSYGKAYNSLQQSLSKAGVLADTGCPPPPRYML